MACLGALAGLSWTTAEVLSASARHGGEYLSWRPRARDRSYSSPQTATRAVARDALPRAEAPRAREPRTTDTTPSTFQHTRVSHGPMQQFWRTLRAKRALQQMQQLLPSAALKGNEVDAGAVRGNTRCEKPRRARVPPHAAPQPPAREPAERAWSLRSDAPPPRGHSKTRFAMRNKKKRAPRGKQNVKP